MIVTKFSALDQWPYTLYNQQEVAVKTLPFLSMSPGYVDFHLPL